MGLFGHFQGIFQENSGLGIGVRDGCATRFLSLRHNLFGGGRVTEDGVVLARRLGNIGILAEEAAEVTPNGGNGVAPGPGIEVIERFLFNWVNVLSDELTVYQRQQGAVAILANPALASHAGLDPARLGTEKAGNRAPFELPVKHRLLHVRSSIMFALRWMKVRGKRSPAPLMSSRVPMVAVSCFASRRCAGSPGRPPTEPGRGSDAGLS